MIVNKRLCVGMMIIAALTEFEKKGSPTDENVNHLNAKLYKKNFPIRNGSAKLRDRVTAAKDKLSRRKKLGVKDTAALKEMERLNGEYTEHAHLADEAWKYAMLEFTSDNYVTMNQLISALLYKHKETKEFYGFNDSVMTAFRGSSEHRDKYVRSSLKAANMLLEKLDIVINNYNK